MWRSTRSALLPVLVAGVLAPGCLFNPRREITPPPPPPPIPEYTTPENVLLGLQVIYNDIIRSAPERRDLYRDLFPPKDHPTVPGFVFRLQPEDVETIGQESWGLDQEIQVHERMFGAQDRYEIFSLSLTIQHPPSTPLEFPGAGQEGWKEIFASNISLRLLFDADDGLAVNGGQARFLFAPADDRWYLAEWIDLPTP